MKKTRLMILDADAPSIIVPSYSVETYFALGEEQAKKKHVHRCIHPELPDHHRVYFAMHSLSKTLYESMERGSIWTEWKFQKDRIEEVAAFIGLSETAYPYRDALDMIDGEYFWIIAWDD